MPSKSLTVRCPLEIVDGIDKQVQQTNQNKTDVVVNMLMSTIPSLKITEREKLPNKPGIYLVYTPEHELLYLGKSDNLKARWNTHNCYQSFIEKSIDCRIGYFIFNNIELIDKVSEEFKEETKEIRNNKELVTIDKFRELESKLNVLENRFNITFKAMAAIGVNNIADRLTEVLPPRGYQEWHVSRAEQKEGLVRSELIKRVGFSSTKEFENALNIYEIDEISYLEELSGWESRPVEEGSSRTRFFPPQD